MFVVYENTLQHVPVHIFMQFFCFYLACNSIEFLFFFAFFLFSVSKCAYNIEVIIVVIVVVFAKENQYENIKYSKL